MQISLFGNGLFPFIFGVSTTAYGVAYLISYVYISIYVYTVYDIPRYTLLHDNVLRVTCALAGVEVLCGRLAALVLV